MPLSLGIHQWRRKYRFQESVLSRGHTLCRIIIGCRTSHVFLGSNEKRSDAFETASFEIVLLSFAKQKKLLRMVLLTLTNKVD